jgi:hypothetical protein
MNWQYNKKEFTEEMIGDSYGFVYLITNLINNKKYIGKKFFSKAGYKTVKGKRKKIRKSSDWLKYYGSNKTLLEDVTLHGEENFKREILHLCKTRSDCAYLELKEQIDNRVLESTDWYNDWIMVKVRKDHIKHFSFKPDTDTYNIPEEEIHISGKITS